MTTYESEIKTISSNHEVVFATLTDLSKAAQFLDKIPEDANISDISCSTETIFFTVNPVGKIGLKIIEKEPHKTIKFGSINSPIEFTLWIQLVTAAEQETKMKITLKAAIPSMIKIMLDNKLEKFVNQLADGIAKINY